jgi:N utilization substance protein B
MAESLPLLPGEHPPLPEAVKVRVIDDGSGRHHSARTKARKAALDALFQADVLGLDALDVLEAGEQCRDYTREVVTGVRFHLDAIDARLGELMTDGWTLERMPALDRALARMSLWELEHGGTAAPVVVAETLELADEYSTDASAKFLNALLGRATGGQS